MLVSSTLNFYLNYTETLRFIQIISLQLWIFCMNLSYCISCYGILLCNWSGQHMEPMIWACSANQLYIFWRLWIGLMVSVSAVHVGGGELYLPGDDPGPHPLPLHPGADVSPVPQPRRLRSVSQHCVLLCVRVWRNIILFLKKKFRVLVFLSRMENEN